MKPPTNPVAEGRALYSAFRDDHAVLERGFHDLRRALLSDDVSTARDIANCLDVEVGAHIAFEETDFYPVLRTFIGDEAVDELYLSHERGLMVVQCLAAIRPDDEVTEEARQHLVVKCEAMESHVAECGALFDVMSRLPETQKADLYRRLITWRQERPHWRDLRQEERRDD